MTTEKTPTEDQIVATMRRLVAESLALPVDDIAPESRLIPDLGADSLDFVDLMFMMEKEFGIKIRDGELASVVTLDFSSPEVMQNGYLTIATVDRLVDVLPALRDVEDTTKVTPAQMFSFITVRTLCSVVQRHVAAT